MTAYRLASYAVTVGSHDVRTVLRDPLTRPAAIQLYSALGSIVANLVEGYSRSSGADRARLFEYALGSAREAREWYRAIDPTLDPNIVRSRVTTLDQICKLLLTTIPAERKRQIRRRT